jgi:hypothetical protein
VIRGSAAPRRGRTHNARLHLWATSSSLDRPDWTHRRCRSGTGAEARSDVGQPRSADCRNRSNPAAMRASERSRETAASDPPIAEAVIPPHRWFSGNAVSPAEPRPPLSASCLQPNGFAASNLARVQAARAQNGVARSHAAQPSSSPIAGPPSETCDPSIYIGNCVLGRSRDRAAFRPGAAVAAG